jgi:hypothetical protein
MDKEPEPWINNPAFNWTPEVPMRLEPRFNGGVGAGGEASEPRFESPASDPVIIVVTPPAAERPAPRPRFTPVIAEEEPQTASAFLPRMAVGLGQGVALVALFTLRSQIDPYIFSASLMVALFSPLLLLAGLGRMRFKHLLVWTVLASGLLAAAGVYHHWRTLSSDSGHPGLALLVLASLFLFVGQSLAETGAGDYSAHYRSAWQLAIRIVLCAIVAGLAWAAAGAATGLMRERYPLLQYVPFMTPLVTVSTALAAQITGRRFLGGLQAGLVFVLTLMLPFVLLMGFAITALVSIGQWQPSLGVTATAAVMLILCINASYRDGTSMRPRWRKRAEFAASLLLLPLALIAAFTLFARIQQHGWSDMRIFAAAGLLLLGAYALCYAGSALISLGGGNWMKRIETSNLALAFAGLALIAVLASPLADPVQLAVKSQLYRLDQHRVGADAFDYAWLRDSGLRFGHEALTKINIHVHSTAGLPAGLLARDWSDVAGAPPCLTSAAMTCDAFFADLDGDGRDEILLAYGSDARWWAAVMKQGEGGGWYIAGTLGAPPCPGSLTALRNGQFSIARPAGNWRDLVLDGMRLSVARPQTQAACPLL